MFERDHFLKTQHTPLVIPLERRVTLDVLPRQPTYCNGNTTPTYTPTNQCYKRTPLNTQKQQVREIKEKENTDYREHYSSETRT